MSDEHNPIAIRLESVQQLWEETRLTHPNINLFCAVSKSEDYPVLEAFVSLECSAQGKSPDTFVAFRTVFDTEKTFYVFLIDEWLTSFERDLKQYPDWHWADFESLKAEFKQLNRSNLQALQRFYVRMVSSFKAFEGDMGNMLIITLIITQFSHIELFNKTIRELIALLPSDTSLLLLDTSERDCYQLLIKEMGSKAAVMRVPDLNLGDACKEIITQGDPSDVHVRYNRCLLQLGEAANRSDVREVKHLGTELISISKEMGGYVILSSAYLFYAGFMLRFTKETEHIHFLLDKGIGIVQPLYKDDSECGSILFQLYLFKASAYCIAHKGKEAIGAIQRGIAIAMELDQKHLVVNGYNSALMVAGQQHITLNDDFLSEAFSYGYALDDDTLRVVNIVFIVHTYLMAHRETDSKTTAQISRRMRSLYGDSWQDTPKDMIRKMEKDYAVMI